MQLHCRPEHGTAKLLPETERHGSNENIRKMRQQVRFPAGNSFPPTHRQICQLIHANRLNRTSIQSPHVSRYGLEGKHSDIIFCFPDSKRQWLSLLGISHGQEHQQRSKQKPWTVKNTTMQWRNHKHLVRTQSHNMPLTDTAFWLIRTFEFRQVCSNQYTEDGSFYHHKSRRRFQFNDRYRWEELMTWRRVPVMVLVWVF